MILFLGKTGTIDFGVSRWGIRAVTSFISGQCWSTAIRHGVDLRSSPPWTIPINPNQKGSCTRAAASYSRFTVLLVLLVPFLLPFYCRISLCIPLWSSAIIPRQFYVLLLYCVLYNNADDKKWLQEEAVQRSTTAKICGVEKDRSLALTVTCVRVQPRHKDYMHLRVLRSNSNLLCALHLFKDYYSS